MGLAWTALEPAPFMIFVNIGLTRRRTIKTRSKSFVSSSPLNALARNSDVLGLFLSGLEARAASQVLSGQPQHIRLTLVPGGGIEPPWCHHRGILSPVRLPIPPSRPRLAIERGGGE